MELEGKKVVIPVETMYNEFEFWYPYYRLKEAGAEVVVVGSGSAGEYTAKSGLPVKVDTSAD
jgi:protease I